MQVQTVTLPGGREVQIRELTWGGWKRVKSLLVALFNAQATRGLASAVQAAIESASTTPQASDDDGDLAALAKRYAAAITPELIASLSAGVGALVQASDELTGVLVDCCCPDLPEDLSAREMLAVCEHAERLSNWRELLEAEKNLWRAALGRLRGGAHGQAAADGMPNGRG